MATHRPPVLITAAAATILGVLYFVPSASASAEHATTENQTQTQTQTQTTTVQQSATPDVADTAQPQLADTGSADTTPYLIGGTAFLGIGAALLVSATRRARGA